MGRADSFAFSAVNANERSGAAAGRAARALKLPRVPEVSPEEAKRLIDAGAQLVDVRIDYEYEAGHIPGARLVPLPDVHSEGARLDRGRPVVVYCRSGDRSGVAADAFAASGWDAHSIEGGLLAWAADGLPLEPDGGAVVERSGLPPF